MDEEKEITQEEAHEIANEWKKEDLIKEGILKIIKTPLTETEEYQEQEREKLKQILGIVYESIIELLKRYISMKEEYYKLVALWIIGTYVHKSFESYPYLFFNAMRGSGKTRTLKLITALSNKGDLLTSLREAVLFRIDNETTLAIDEFESINSKENQALRELLNACYKKGTTVKRVKQVKTLAGNDYKLESYEPYKPIVMANIWGLEEVLSDRAITIILEKCSDQRITHLAEDFTENSDVSFVKGILNASLVYMCSYFGKKGYTEGWNFYINSRYSYIYTLTTLTALTALTTLKYNGVVDKKLDLKTIELFNKIHDTGITGRNLELFFPLFILADFIGGDIINDIFDVAKILTKEKRKDEMLESRDVLLIDFVSRNFFEGDFASIKKITAGFRTFVGDESEEEKWVNPRWIGRALKRLSLVLDKRRMKEGIEIRLDIKKAQEKIQMFKGDKE